MSASSQKIIEEQSARFYTLYERKSKVFRTALIGVSGLVTIVFVLIFYPYVTFRGARYALEAELAGLGARIVQLEQRETEYRELLGAFWQHMPVAFETISGIEFRDLANAEAGHRRKLAVVKAALRDDPDLRPWLNGTSAGRELPAGLLRRHPDLQAANGDPCFWLSAEAWTRCAFTLRLARLHATVVDPFGYKRISHLRNELFVPLAEALDKLHGDFEAWLQGKAPSWDAEGVRAHGELRDHYRFFNAVYVRRIEEHERLLVEGGHELGAELRGLIGKRENTDQELKQVVARLAEMTNLRDVQTPFGPLPVGLNDLVLLFPVLLAAGFLLLASLFSETLQLRQVFHRLCRAKDPEGEIFDRQHIALVAPVWVDPLQPKGHRAYRMAILALPAVVFAVAIMLLLDNRLLWGAFMAEVRLGSVIYIALYVSSALCLAEGGRRVWRALRAYEASP
jgi:hypothetical protein